MFKHLEQEHYEGFKKIYRLRRFRDNPCKTIEDIVLMGYLDVNRTLRGIRKYPKQAEKFKSAAIKFIQSLKEKKPEKQEEFDGRHRAACEECCASKEDSNGNGIEIHYGQAQKIINMSLKYFYNEYALAKENHIEYPNNNIEFYFQLPVDGIILEHLRNCHGFGFENIAWSTWDEKTYLNFQRKLRERLIDDYKPLEIDYLAWGIDHPCDATRQAIKAAESA